MWRAIQERFPGFTIQGCIFHWTQAVYRKVQEIGLQVLIFKFYFPLTSHVNDQCNILQDI